ncbi:g1506 [Coccomyxa elongata]
MSKGLMGLQNWWKRLTGTEDEAAPQKTSVGTQTEGISSSASQSSEAALRRESVSSSPARTSAADSNAQSPAVSGPSLHYSDAARTSLPPGATVGATSSAARQSAAGQNGSVATTGSASLNGKAPSGHTPKAGQGNGSKGAPKEQATPKGSAGDKNKSATKEATQWEKALEVQEWEDDSGTAKPSIAGYAMLAGMLLAGLLLTSWLFKGLGYLRSKKRAKAGTPAAAAVLAREERRRKGAGKKAKQFAREGTMTGTIEEAAPKPGTQQPSEKDSSKGKVEEMGEFRPYDKGELEGMRQAADKQAAKVEQQVKQTDPQGVPPPTVDTERGEPKVWLPGEGWVVVEPMEDMSEAGYAADSEDTMQRDVQGQSETRTVPGAPSEQPADDTGLQSSQEQPEASAQGDDASQQGAVASAADLTEAPGEQWLGGEEDGASIEAVHGSAEDGEGRDIRRDASGVVSGSTVGHSQQEGEHEQRDYQWDDEVGDRRWDLSEAPPLPHPGDMEQPSSAVDPGYVQSLPSDLSVKSLRERTAVALQASLAAGEASHRAASYSAAASAASTRAADAAQRAAAAASRAQAALELVACDAVEDAVHLAEAAMAEAEAAEGRAAAAAAVSTAHEEVAGTQAGAAEQAAKVEEAAAGQGVLRSSQRRARSAWYSAKFGAERAGHVLLGWFTAAWLWLVQAWDVVAGWGHHLGEPLPVKPLTLQCSGRAPLALIGTWIEVTRAKGVAFWR